MCEFYIKPATWASHQPQLRLIREQVFVLEQNVPAHEEWDAHDSSAQHLLAYNHMQQPIGCARLLDASKIGRMAVLKDWRGKGVGQALVNHAVELLKQQGCKRITLSAQTHAVGFYQQLGFKISSKPYLDANIWHVDMQLLL